MFFNKLKYNLMILLLLISTQSYALICSDYGDFKEYGGHYYSTTVKKLTFKDAKLLAENSGGYLAIPNSSSENAFIAGLIKDGEYSWIGIHDPSLTANYCYSTSNCSRDDSRFKTVKNTALSYKNWAEYQPDNLVMEYDVMDGKEQVTPLGEHWVAMAYSGKWADFGNHKTSYNNPIKYYAVFEFDTMPDCYTPPTNFQEDQIAGTKCSTKIYNKDINQAVDTGQLYDCQQDQYGTDYCPSQMAPCAQEWDYIDGTSQQVDTTLNTNPNCNGTMVNGVCYEQVGNATKVTNLSCRNISVPCMPGADSCCHIDFSCNNNQATVKYYDCCPSQGSLKRTVTVSDPNNFLNGVTYQQYGSAKIVCNKSGACSVYFQNYYCNGGLIGSPYLTNSFSLNTSTEYKCNDNQFVGSQAYQGADPTKCYNGYEPSCNKGSLNTSTNKCELDYTYYNYLCNNDKNEYGLNYVPQNTGGDCNGVNLLPDGSCNSSTPPTNNCKREKYTCKEAPDRKCAYVNNEYQCSPYPCFGGDDIETTDTQVGLNDADNNGWDNSGNCLGQIYIFNGQDNRCRSKDILFGLVGGGCCDKDKVFLGLVACKEEEKKLAKLNDQERCHYVGEYCSKKLNLGFTKICVQWKKSHCCFNSKLARIINEQGRPQLAKGWGSAESPECKGFTPEEFQKLDFSKIDMSEFFGEIQQNFNVNFMQNQQNFIQNRITNNMNNISGN